MQSDPIGLAGGLNTYGYVGGNPVVWFDLIGLKAGDLYGSMDEAAKNALCDSNPISIIEKVEYGGRIYKVPFKEQYSYTEPYTDHSPNSVNSYSESIPFFAITVAVYHTHGWEDPAYGKGLPGVMGKWGGNNAFSKTDVNNADNRDLPSYLGTPSNGFWKYDPTNLTLNSISSACSCQK